MDARGGGIVVVGRDGTSPRRLTAQGYHPAWSPDGRLIVVQHETNRLASYEPAVFDK